MNPYFLDFLLRWYSNIIYFQVFFKKNLKFPLYYKSCMDKKKTKPIKFSFEIFIAKYYLINTFYSEKNFDPLLLFLVTVYLALMPKPGWIDQKHAKHLPRRLCETSRYEL